ncbi:MAG TPA: hypothetical protein K8U92_04340 [Aliarcobacter thereius]|uniref:formyltransferase family protein n=1 Tax=Aliarcobacter thereius TaxID=544718 RepID=UPI0010FE2CC5|nr:formyltransferase family protein [Aliarcobacter thereius]TLT08734.1 hypothetical protein FE243_02205 [Aliarcobacter thereius]HJE03087.1 hypothetical protein [Aliarcobacter thereius]
MKRFAFYVSNEATRLKKTLQMYKSIKLLKQIEFVLIDNCDNSQLKNICKDMEIAYYEVNLKKHENKYISDMFLKYLEKHNVDNAFIFSDKILTGKLLIKYKNRIINFHPSILPAYKGLYAIDKALASNSLLLGNSAHIVTEEIDGGTIIMQNLFPAIKFKNYDEVLDKQIYMLLQIMIWIQQDRLYIDKNDKVFILNAHYEIQEFIPNLEIKEGKI